MLTMTNLPASVVPVFHAGRAPLTAAGLLIAAILFLPGCSSFQLASRWQENEITMDGRGGVFPDSLHQLDNPETEIAVTNDERFLYVKLRSWNMEVVRQIIRGGLTIWFDRDGGKEKRFGIHFPLGMAGAPSRTRGGIPNDRMTLDASELEIMGNEGDRHRMTFAEAGSIDARLSIPNDTLTYTLKIAISNSGAYPFTVGVAPGAVIGIGIETTPLGGAEASRGSSREDPGSGGSGGRGGRGSRGGGGGGGRAQESGRPVALNVWGTVRLAAK